MVAALVAAACGQSTPAEKEAPAASPAAAPAPAAEPAAAEPATISDLFPPGNGRELVLANCSTCHNVACSVIGQRTPERWASLEVAHRDKLSGVDLPTIFSYLRSNFDASKPEPKVPARFLEGGCTPF